MNAKNYFQVIFFLLITSKSFGQITLSLDQIYLNSQTSIENCSTVDFGTTVNNNLVFYYTLEKSVNQAVADGTIKVTLKYNSNSIGAVKATQFVSSASWNLTTQYSHTISTNIQASDIQVSGSSILLEFIEGGFTYKSCEYSLIKTPTFTLSPSSLSLACGNTSTRTFTVTPANIPSGVNVTYNWSYSGWSLGSSTTTSKTLQPISDTTLPSNVSVTPYIDGVAQQTKTCNVSHSIFSTSATIEGSGSLCSTGTYSINNLPNGVSIQSISSSNTNIATASLGTNNNIMVTKVSNGTITLSVVLQNACSQTATKTKNIQVGENANVDVTGLENGIDAGGSVNLSLINSNGCGEIFLQMLQVV